MRRGLVLVFLAGCEMDTSPPPLAELPETMHHAGFRNLRADRQIVDVTVLEYGTKTPVGDAAVQLARPPSQTTSLTTNDEGRAHFDLPTEDWQVAHVTAPDYLTSCPPAFEDNDWHHPLVDKHQDGDRDEYTCLLVPRSALVVRDRASALRLARADADVGPWLRGNPDAEVTRIDLRGIHWQVMFVASSDPLRLRSVSVDGLDKRTHVDMAYDDQPFGDYLPSGM